MKGNRRDINDFGSPHFNTHTLLGFHLSTPPDQGLLATSKTNFWARLPSIERYSLCWDGKSTSGTSKRQRAKRPWRSSVKQKHPRPPRTKYAQTDRSIPSFGQVRAERLHDLSGDGANVPRTPRRSVKETRELRELSDGEQTKKTPSCCDTMAP